MSQIKAYVTKHCLAKGIELVEGESIGDFLRVQRETGPVEYGPKDWYTSYEQARVRAEFVRKDKIRSTKRYTARLEALVFGEQADDPA